MKYVSIVSGNIANKVDVQLFVCRVVMCLKCVYSRRNTCDINLTPSTGHFFFLRFWHRTSFSRALKQTSDTRARREHKSKLTCSIWWRPLTDGIGSGMLKSTAVFVQMTSPRTRIVPTPYNLGSPEKKSPIYLPTLRTFTANKTKKKKWGKLVNINIISIACQ